MFSLATSQAAAAAAVTEQREKEERELRRGDPSRDSLDKTPALPLPVSAASVVPTAAQTPQKGTGGGTEDSLHNFSSYSNADGKKECR